MVVGLGRGGGGVGAQVVREHPGVLAHCGRGECQGHSWVRLALSARSPSGVTPVSRSLRAVWEVKLPVAPPPPRPRPASAAPRAPPTWGALVLVLLQVAVQVGLLPEAAVAQVALERLLLVVDVPHVPLQVGGDAE